MLLPGLLAAFSYELSMFLHLYNSIYIIVHAMSVLQSQERLPLLQGTLVGLLAAFNYELSILHTASRLTSADAFRTLHALYRERTHPLSLSPGAAAAGEVLFVKDAFTTCLCVCGLPKILHTPIPWRCHIAPLRKVMRCCCSEI